MSAPCPSPSEAKHRLKKEKGLGKGCWAPPPAVGKLSGCLVQPAEPCGKRGPHRSSSSLNFSGCLWSFLCLVRRRQREPGKKKPQPAGAPKLRDPATVNSDAAPRAAGEGRAEGQGRGAAGSGQGGCRQPEEAKPFHTAPAGRAGCWLLRGCSTGRERRT